VKTDLKVKTKPLPINPFCRVHMGFFKAFQTLWPGIKETLEELIEEVDLKKKKFLFEKLYRKKAKNILLCFSLATV
jgi:hypothetical protein